MTPVAVDVKQAMRGHGATITVRVVGLRMFKFRLKLMSALLWLVSVVAPFNVAIETEFR